MTECVKEGLSCKLSQQALNMKKVGAATFDLCPVVCHVVNQCSFVRRTSKGLVVAVQNAYVTAVSIQRVEYAGPGRGGGSREEKQAKCG